MRVSLWRQFSGNHSSGFTLVGVFDSQEAAAEGAARLRGMLAEIAAWRLSNPENDDSYVDGHPTPPEIAFGKAYGFEWGGSLDWLPYPEELNTIITQHGPAVFLTPSEETFQTPTEVLLLMERLGATAWLNSEEDGVDYGPLSVTVRCSTPDDQTVLDLEAELTKAFAYWQERWAEKAVDKPYLETRTANFLHRNQKVIIEGYPASFFQELLARLNRLGCTNITYSFKKEGDGERRPIDELGQLHDL